jgi:photosystem II stability/assembly factor-like uncharacterized protein
MILWTEGGSPVFVDSLNAWAAAGGNLLLCTDDGGWTWHRASVSFGAAEGTFAINGYFFLSAKTAFVGLRNRKDLSVRPSKLASTHDSGRAWKIESFPNAHWDLESLAADEEPEGRLWLAGKVLHTDAEQSVNADCPDNKDAARSSPVIFFRESPASAWEEQSFPVRNGCSVSFIQLSAKTGAVAVAGSAIAYSRDGRRWEMSAVQSSQKVSRVISLQLLGSDGWISCDDGRVLKTTDGGQSWREIPGTAAMWGERGTFGNWGETYFISSLVGFTLRGIGVLFETKDGGLNWTRLSIPADISYLTCAVGQCWLRGEWLYRIDGQ